MRGPLRNHICTALELDSVQMMSEIVTTLKSSRDDLLRADFYNIDLSTAASLFCAAQCAQLLGLQIQHRPPVDKERLMCPVCQELLLSPLLSWCEHAICRVCALRTMMTTPLGACACPVCRSPLAFPGGYRSDAALGRACELARTDEDSARSDDDLSLDRQLQFFWTLSSRIALPAMFSGDCSRLLLRLGMNWVQFSMVRTRGTTPQYRLFVSVENTDSSVALAMQQSRFVAALRISPRIIVVCMYLFTCIEDMQACFREFKARICLEAQL